MGVGGKTQENNSESTQGLNLAVFPVLVQFCPTETNYKSSVIPKSKAVTRLHTCENLILKRNSTAVAILQGSRNTQTKQQGKPPSILIASEDLLFSYF